MKQDKKKVNKVLNKRCPDCGAKELVITTESKNINGVEYSEKFIECNNCGYTEKVRQSPKRCKEIYNPHF